MDSRRDRPRDAAIAARPA